MLPFVSLNAATTTGPGTAKDLEGVFSTHTLVVTGTGSPTSVSVYLEGSLDGISWVLVGSASGVSFPVYGSVGDHAFRYVRANVVTLSGGTSPTVTATIASA